MNLTLLIASCLLFAAVHSAPAGDPEVIHLVIVYVLTNDKKVDYL